MVAQTKKTTTKKTVSAKKTEATKTTKKTEPTKQVKKVEPKVKTAEVSTTQVSKPETKTPAKKVYEVSRLHMITFISLMVIAYIQIVGIIYLYNNFDISIRSYESIERERIAEQRHKQRMAAIKKRRAARGNVARRGKNARQIFVESKIEDGKEIASTVEITKEVKKETKKATCPPLKLEPRKAAFIEEEYAPYAGEGHAVIEGAACFELQDGSTKCFENADVFINPVTTYSNEWYSRHWVGNERLAQADERAVKYNKMIKTGKDGKFKFDKLKPGSYYVGFTFCMPEGKDAKECVCSRFASKVKMKNLVRTTLKKVYPASK